MTNRALASTEESNTQPAVSRPVLIIAGIILIAFTMRSPLTSVGPLVGFIREDLGLTNGVAGLITTVPLLAFGFLSPLAPKLGHRFGSEKSLLAGLLLLIAGILLRSTGYSVALFLGTALIGGGIAISNVLLPGLVKQRFAKKAGLMTSTYTTSMSICAALASGVSIPLATGAAFGWQGSLAFWAIPVILAIVAWLPQLRGTSVAAASAHAVSTSKKGLWSSLLAWQVTLFMGLQSFCFYCTIAWLPEIVQSHGIDVTRSGWMLSIVQFISLPTTFLAPVLASRLTNQRLMAASIGFLSLLGFAGLLVVGNQALLLVCLALLGMAQGASISLALTFIVMRAGNVRQAAELSGMAQSVGYFLAAFGPMLVGFLFDLSHSWTIPLVTLAVVSLLQTIAGFGAGRNETV